MTEKPKKFIFNKLDGKKVWYSACRVCTPAGRLKFGAILKPQITKFEKEDAEKENREPIPSYHGNLMWENEEVLKSQEVYGELIKQGNAFIDAVMPKLKDKVIWPVREVVAEDDLTGDKDEDPDQTAYWKATSRAKLKNPPRLYHVKRRKLVSRKDIDPDDCDYFYDGCIAAFEGPMVLSIVGREVYLSIQMETVYHVDDGERDSGKPRITRNLSSFGLTSEEDITEQDLEEGDGNI